MGLPPSALWEFSPDDLDLLIASREIQADTGSYGESISEATSEAANPNNYAGGIRYSAEGPFTNYAARTAEDAKEKWRTENPGVSMAGLNWVVRRHEYTPMTEAPN